MTGRLLVSDAEADAAEIEALLEEEIDQLRKRVTVLEGTLRSVRDSLAMTCIDPDVVVALREEIERVLAKNACVIDASTESAQ
jgi:hypothetical protein